ncbi:MAG TPA: hypothetical protein H9795_08600 [Candidatus Fournierella merdigallinarum]|nr:hypothetical protein [Candidatus Fournierella merdigallinarum]
MRSAIVKYGLFAALGLAALYLAVQVFTVLDRPYKTETAILYDMSDSLYCSGYLVFQQQEVAGEGQLGYLVANGERVAAGTQVAEIYTDASQARARLSLTELDEQLELLEHSENTAGSDLDLLLSQRQSALYDLLDQMDRHDYARVSETGDEYLLALNRLQITTGTVKDFSEAKALIADEQAIQLANLGSPQAVTVSTGGYFVAADAAQLLTYTQKELDEMTPAQLQESLSQGKGYREVSGAGKLVTSYKWYFYGLCTEEESRKFTDVSSVDISFPGAAEKVLPATVESVTVDEESGLAKFVLSCEYVGADVLSLASATARIDFESYKGIRFSARALNIVDGEKGVYVKYGNLARFRKITVLYQDDEYILVPQGGKVGTDNELRLFDEVIVEGTDLRDGKIL